MTAPNAQIGAALFCLGEWILGCLCLQKFGVQLATVHEVLNYSTSKIYLLSFHL